jgi:MoaA/NifB/PqqE/SkfB family radical SAM enzyme
MVAGFGIRRFAVKKGSPRNWAERPPPEEGHFSGRPADLMPLCYVPWSSMTIRYDGNAIPCCFHRLGEQYAVQPPRHLLGNVLESSVWSVWNGPTYRAIRRIASHPARAESLGELQESFCHGCRRVTRPAPT